MQITYLPHPRNISSEEDTSKEDESNTENKNYITALGTNNMDVDKTVPLLNSSNMSIAVTPLNIAEYTDTKCDVLGKNDEENSEQHSISNQNYTYDDSTNTSTDTIAYDAEVTNTEPNPDFSLQDLFLVRDRHNTPIPSVAKLWKNDALAHRWTVPLKNLSKVDIYMLSRPGPKWDEIDPYSGLEEANVPDNENTSAEPNNANPNSMTKITKINNKNDAYHLQKRASPKSVIRKSRQTQNAKAIYAEIESCSSSNDSDYTPKPKCTKRSHIGLREPLKSRIRAQQIINASRNNRPLSTMNTDPMNNSFPIPPSTNDENRDKQCPQCDTKFFYESSVNTHLAHAHRIPTWPPDIDNTETSKQLLNKYTRLNNREILGSNESTMQGTNISRSIQLNGHAVLGINNGIMQGTNSKEPPHIRVDANPNVIGITIDSNQCMEGINTRTPTKQNITLETDTTKNTEAHNSIETPNNKTVSSPKTAIPDKTLTAEDGAQTSAKSSSAPITRFTEEHKCRLKPKGKHKHPKLPSLTVNTNTSPTPKLARKSEFVTVTHGL